MFDYNISQNSKKNIYILVLLSLASNRIFSMDVPSMDVSINYSTLFKLCEYEEIESMKNFIEKNPSIDNNYRCPTTGETACLRAARFGRWTHVWYLLEHCNVNRMITDNDGVSLLSIACYQYYWTVLKPFNRLLRMYSYQEINDLCKTMPLYKDMCEARLNEVKPICIKALQKEKWDNSQIDFIQAMHEACFYHYIPTIIQFLKKGAFLDIKNVRNKTAYEILEGKDREYKAYPFVIREAFNNGSCWSFFSAALIKSACETINLLDVAQYIQQLYIRTTILPNLLVTPEARIWKPECKNACKMMNCKHPIHKDDCLMHILLLPQEQKTELNITLIEQGHTSQN